MQLTFFDGFDINRGTFAGEKIVRTETVRIVDLMAVLINAGMRIISIGKHRCINLTGLQAKVAEMKEYLGSLTNTDCHPVVHYLFMKDMG